MAHIVVSPSVTGWKTREEAQAAGEATGVAFELLAYVDDYDGHGEAWVGAEEINGEPGIGNVLCWGVTDETGEQMLDEDGEWDFVA